MFAERNACGAFTSIRFMDFKFVSNIRKTLKIRVLSFSLLRFILLMTLLHNLTADLYLIVTDISQISEYLTREI